MSGIAYVNGRYLPHAEASVHIEDRGFQFSDGVYEVIEVHGGRRIDEEPHLERLDRSMGELEIRAPFGREAFRIVMDEILRRNRLRNALLYIQVTRGTAPREHAYPRAAITTLAMTVRPAPKRAARAVEEGVSVITIADIRWKRCDIKTVALLPNVMGKQQAKQAGAVEAWQVDEQGTVTEGTSTNAWIAIGERAVATHPADARILDGVTRRTVIDLARRAGIEVREQPFSLSHALSAPEAFLTSTSSHVLPVTQIDGKPIGQGNPGPISVELARLYETHISGPRE